MIKRTVSNQLLSPSLMIANINLGTRWFTRLTNSATVALLS